MIHGRTWALATCHQTDGRWDCLLAMVGCCLQDDLGQLPRFMPKAWPSTGRWLSWRGAAKRTIPFFEWKIARKLIIPLKRPTAFQWDDHLGANTCGSHLVWCFLGGPRLHQKTQERFLKGQRCSYLVFRHVFALSTGLMGHPTFRTRITPRFCGGVLSPDAWSLIWLSLKIGLHTPPNVKFSGEDDDQPPDLRTYPILGPTHFVPSSVASCQV